MNKKRRFISYIFLIIISCFSINQTFAQKRSETFEFQFEGKTLNGLIEFPIAQKPTSLIIIVPGSGRTDFVKGNRYNDLRNFFVSIGMTCCFWDKPGCGKSEGEFKQIEHPFKRNADIIIAAIDKLKNNNIAGSERIGLWGISLAGWYCPFVLKKDTSIVFWISVSCPDDNDQSVYQLKTNLLLQDIDEKEVQLLTDEYLKGETIFVSGGSYDEYLEATKNMRKNQYCVDIAGKTEYEDYNRFQKLFLSFGYKVDHKTGKVYFNPGFKEAVSSINCPVLAIFGEKDSQVNWRNTIQFYKETFGSKKGSDLTIKTFPNCNHGIQKCRTGAREENLSEFGFELCDGYYNVMRNWIEEHGFNK